VVTRFKYLGTALNDTNEEKEEIQARILAGNKAYSTLQTIFRSKQTIFRSKQTIFRSKKPYYDLNKPYSDLNKPYSDLNKPYSDLNKPYSDLNKPYSDLNKPYSDLNKPYSDLNKSIETIKQVYFNGFHPVVCIYRNYMYIYIYNNKIRLYKTLIKPILSYRSVTCTLTQTTEQMLNTFERKILRRIYGPIQERGRWRPRWNNELYTLYNDLNIVEDTKIRRLGWVDHIIRMEEDSIPKKVLNGTYRNKRPVGRPRIRWADMVQRDALQLLGVRGWRKRASNRDEWRHALREAKARKGL
jgi:hypothetical protein